MNRTVIDVLSGIQRSVPLTEEEIKLLLDAQLTVEKITRITRYQGKLLLVKMGLYPSVVEYIDNHQEVGAKLGFYDSTYWVITDPWINTAREHFNWTPEELQGMFNEAAKL